MNYAQKNVSTYEKMQMLCIKQITLENNGNNRLQTGQINEETFFCAVFNVCLGQLTMK